MAVAQAVPLRVHLDSSDTKYPETSVRRQKTNMLQRISAFWIIACGAILSFALRVGALLTTGCRSFSENHELNMTQLLKQSRRVLIHQEELGYLERSQFMGLIFAVLQHRGELQLPGVCPCAVVVAAAVQLGIEAYNIEHGALHTNYDHVTAFHRTGVLDRTIMNASAICSVAEGRFWPIAHAVDVLLTTKRSMMERLQRVGDWVATFQDESTITDEQHIEALADAAAVFDSEGLEWWPCRGTLIALLRHGKRSGVLSKGKLDVVDHDVDIMVCVSSHEKWAEQRLSVEKKLQERGWSHCFERYSASESYEGHQYHFARGDLWLCTRTDPKVTLDIATYIIDGPIAYAQKYCLPSSHSALRSRCWFPQNDGTFRGSRGRLRISAIRPLKRCKAGHLSVPCPREPLETLRATMTVNFTGSCVALPDIEQRLERDLYDSDKDAWLSEGLTKEDVEILRQRAADLDKEGYLSMTPYLRCADLSG